jgi:hypothetical protein
MIDLYFELWAEFWDMLGLLPLPRKPRASIPDVWPL